MGSHELYTTIPATSNPPGRQLSKINDSVRAKSDAPNEGLPNGFSNDQANISKPQISVKILAEARTVGELISLLGARSSLLAAMNVLGIGLDAPFDFVQGGSGLFANLALPQDNFLAITIESGELSRYADYGEESERSSGGTVSRAEAIQHADCLLRALFLPEIDSSWNVDLDSTRMQWHLHKTLEYQGIPGAGLIKFSISAVTGNILNFVHAPALIPQSFSVKLSEKEAIESARDLVNELDKYGGVLKAQLRIVFPNNFLDENVSRPRIETKPTISWVVSVHDNGDTPLVVFIDAESGALLGGVTRSGP
jgi:hypothetical protein